jgi:fructose-1,6-bisphosphatase/inositol monophosphatase family enzyme
VTDEPDDLALASNLVRAAGTLAADMRRSGVRSSRKTSVTDLVTPADHAAEALIVNGLRAARPEDGIVAEEGSSQPGRRTWFVDPIDGTYNYATGVTLWCSAVGLTEAGEPLLGAVYHPAADDLWSGGPGRPTTRNGEPVSPIADRPLVEAAVASYLHPTTMPDDSVREPLLRALRRAGTVRTYGSGSIELAWVADGRLGGFLQHDCLPWDWLPGAALVAAAGGDIAVVPANGHRWYLAGSKQLVDDLATVLRGSA